MLVSPLGLFNNRVIQKFKNLYSHLIPSGLKFDVNSPVLDQKNGEKSNWSFVRKCFTLNRNSRTEEMLDQYLEAYRAHKLANPDAQDFAESKEFAGVASTIKQKYTVGCTDEQSEIQGYHNEIDGIANFIKSYLSAEPGWTPNNQIFYFQGSRSSLMTFFKPQQPQRIAGAPGTTTTVRLA